MKRWPRALRVLPALGALLVPGSLALHADQGQLVQGQPVDLELVLAVDASSSVNRNEFDLQMRGLATAFRDPEVQRAISLAGSAGVAVLLFQWADNRNHSVTVGWTLLRSAEDAEAFAARIDDAGRGVVGGGTAIGGAIQYALAQLGANPYAGQRQVIDVSGDGRANQGSDPRDVRELAAATGVVVNGLTILNEDPTLDVYYRRNVIAGPGAFVIATPDYDAYAEAIRQKLIREISDAPVALLQVPGGG